MADELRTSQGSIGYDTPPQRPPTPLTGPANKKLLSFFSQEPACLFLERWPEDELFSRDMFMKLSLTLGCVSPQSSSNIMRYDLSKESRAFNAIKIVFFQRP
jgi:hypothetical protein